MGEKRVRRQGVKSEIRQVYHLIHVAAVAWFGVATCAAADFDGLYISEFLASNSQSLADEDGKHSDWIEIHNPTDADVSLAGWYLTDDADEPMKWRIPDVELASQEYLVVFASGKDRDDPDHPLHTNFSLKSAGEYLALVRPDGHLVAHAFAPRYPKQRNDISYGAVPRTRP